MARGSSGEKGNSGDAFCVWDGQKLEKEDGSIGIEHRGRTVVRSGAHLNPHGHPRAPQPPPAQTAAPWSAPLQHRVERGQRVSWARTRPQGAWAPSAAAAGQQRLQAQAAAGGRTHLTRRAPDWRAAACSRAGRPPAAPTLPPPQRQRTGACQTAARCPHPCPSLPACGGGRAGCRGGGQSGVGRPALLPWQPRRRRSCSRRCRRHTRRPKGGRAPVAGHPHQLVCL